MTAQANPRQHPNAAWREVEGSVVIISPEDSVLHELNETASFIWKRATGEHSVPQIAAQLAAEFEVDAATAEHDTAELLEQFTNKRLLAAEADR